MPKDYAHTPVISLVFVDEAYRGNRLSQQLIGTALKYAKELYYKTVYLKSEHRGLYEKYGFEKICEFEPVEPPADQLRK
ncbi:MAG: GNAT family N-acetyltransferase [Firmicutes bacterium]|nr:GNAT family N-acetyltransferase [Bacillota bacterium]